MLVRTLLQHVTSRLAAARVPEDGLAAAYIVAAALGHSNLDALRSSIATTGTGTNGGGPPLVANDAQVQRANDATVRRIRREPLQYIVGDWDFDVLQSIVVRPPVLIPRPETSQLVSLAATVLRRRAGPRRPLTRILDVGCGSGAISIALLRRLPELLATAIDASESAIELSRENAHRFAVADRFTVAHCPLQQFALPPGSQRFDLVVSNPPYVPDAEFAGLQPEVREWEDPGALKGGPNEGLDIICSLLASCVEHDWLREGGFLLLETHTTHHALLRALLSPTRPPVGGRDDGDAWMQTPLQSAFHVEMGQPLGAARATSGDATTASTEGFTVWEPESPLQRFRMRAALGGLLESAPLHGALKHWAYVAGLSDFSGRPRFVVLQQRACE